MKRVTYDTCTVCLKSIQVRYGNRCGVVLGNSLGFIRYCYIVTISNFYRNLLSEEFLGYLKSRLGCSFDIFTVSKPLVRNSAFVSGNSSCQRIPNLGRSYGLGYRLG